MDDQIAAYIADEEAKIKALREEADAREADLAAVRVLYERVRSGKRSDVIDLNALVRPAAVSDTPAPAASPAPPPETAERPAPQTALDLKGEWPVPAAKPLEAATQQKRQMHKKGEVRTAILRTMADEQDKRINDVLEGVAKQGYSSLTYNHVRTELWTMKHQGLTSSPENGVYRIAAKGVAFLQGHKGESPAATGPSSATKSHADNL